MQNGKGKIRRTKPTIVEIAIIFGLFAIVLSLAGKLLLQAVGQSCCQSQDPLNYALIFCNIFIYLSGVIAVPWWLARQTGNPSIKKVIIIAWLSIILLMLINLLIPTSVIYK